MSDTSSGGDSDGGEYFLEEHVQAQGHFHGVYLLVSKNPKFSGRTYVGYTVNPNRRIKQHNGGRKKGGARQTSGKGPWDMILIIHGFPNSITALRFEWAWQHPSRSRRLGSAVAKRHHKETNVQYKVRVLSVMLSVGPWSRLGLTVRWLKQEYQIPFPVGKEPPIHMPIAYGLIELSKEGCSNGNKFSDGTTADAKKVPECDICSLQPLGFCCFLGCYHKHCSFVAHTICLASILCEEGQIIPINGRCPACQKDLLWGELVRRSAVAKDYSHCSLLLNNGPIVSKQKENKKYGGVPSVSHWTEGLHVT